MEKADRQRWPAIEWKARFRLLAKKLSATLRHTGVKEGFELRRDGCIAVRDLIANHRYKQFTEEDILTCVSPGHNKKERFELRVDGGTSWVRARQGHSKEVAEKIDEHELTTPITLETAPRIAIHGTFSSLLAPIRKEGLKRFERQHIHMATGLPSDGNVISGCRTGTDVFLYIDVTRAITDGIEFVRSGNDVILTPGIEGILPSKYFICAINRKGSVIFGRVPEQSSSQTRQHKGPKDVASERASGVKSTASPSELSFFEKDFLKKAKLVRAILKLEADDTGKLDQKQKEKLEKKDVALQDLAVAEKDLPQESDLREKNNDLIALLRPN